jgi:hypothetical protein
VRACVCVCVCARAQVYAYHGLYEPSSFEPDFLLFSSLPYNLLALRIADDFYDIFQTYRFSRHSDSSFTFAELRNDFQCIAIISASYFELVNYDYPIFSS